MGLASCLLSIPQDEAVVRVLSENDNLGLDDFVQSNSLERRCGRSARALTYFLMS